jgi:16S rRNA (uracil1498-N3)-methyltransferase
MSQFQPGVTRLFVEAPLASGETVDLDEGRAHKLRHVLRLSPGAEVMLFNGRDGEWLARIGDLKKRSARLDVVRQIRPQTPEPDIWLLFAPIKGERIDGVAEKATELGVSALLPVSTERTVVARINRERLLAHAVAAAEQCRRLSVPAVAKLRPLAEALADWPAKRRLLLADETGASPPLATSLRGMSPPLAVLIGPEGGFAASELDDLKKRSFVIAVGLGPRILRADTAAVAALSIAQALAGDWSRPA